MNYVIGIICINIVIGLVEKFFYPSTFLVILQTILAIIGLIIFYEEKKREREETKRISSIFKANPFFFYIDILITKFNNWLCILSTNLRKFSVPFLKCHFLKKYWRK